MNTISMYELPPIYDHNSENNVVLPQNMYKVPLIYENKCLFEKNVSPINGQINGLLDNNLPKSRTNLLINIEDFRGNELALNPLKDLISRQQLLLARIEDLEKAIDSRLNLKSEDKSSRQENKALSSSVRAKEKVLNDPESKVLTNYSVGLKDEVLRSVRDIVIFTSPRQIPISVLAVINSLKSLGLEVMFNIHNHSSLDIKTKTDSHLNELNAILSSVNINLKNNSIKGRLDHDLIVTIIFKDIAEHEMILSLKDLVSIRGEANILRFVARIAANLKPELSYLYEGITDISRLTLVDNLVDEIHENLFVDSSNDTKFDSILDSSLDSKKYLTGNSPTIADLLLWSAVSHKSSKLKLSQTLERWLTNTKQFISTQVL